MGGPFVKKKNIFLKNAQNRGNVKYVKCVWWPPAKNVLETGKMLNMLNVLHVLGEIRLGKTQTLNIFNISLVLSMFDRKHLTLSLFRGHGVAKQGKC